MAHRVRGKPEPAGSLHTGHSTWQSGFLGGSVVKNPPADAGDIRQVQSLGWEDPLEEEMATHSSILALEMPGTEESGGLQPTGSQRVRHDSAHTQAARIHRARFLLIPLRVSVFCLEPPPHLYCT